MSRIKNLTPKNFAKMFVRTRSGTEAALRLGADPAEAKLIEAKMLSNLRVKDYIRELDKDDAQTLCYVKTGLSRLAFGSINDAAALMFSEDPDPAMIASADLFNVSEIKRVKGGGIELKFFDRQKAMEKLVELDPELKDVSAAQEFINALTQAANEDQYEEEEDDDEEAN